MESTVSNLIKERLDDESLFFDSTVVIQKFDSSVVAMGRAEEILDGDADYLGYEVVAEDRDDDDNFIIVCEKSEEE